MHKIKTMSAFYTANDTDISQRVKESKTKLFLSFKEAEIFAKKNNSYLFSVYNSNKKFYGFGVNIKTD